MVALFGWDLATHVEDWCSILGHDRPALCKQVVITFGNPRPIPWPIMRCRVLKMLSDAAIKKDPPPYPPNKRTTEIESTWKIRCFTNFYNHNIYNIDKGSGQRTKYIPFNSRFVKLKKNQIGTCICIWMDLKMYTKLSP